MSASRAEARRLSPSVPLRRRSRVAGAGAVEVAALVAVGIAVIVAARPPVALPGPADLPLTLALSLMAGLTRGRRLGPWRVEAGAVTPAFIVAALLLLGTLPALACLGGALLAEVGLGATRPRTAAYALIHADAILAAAAVSHRLGGTPPLAATPTLLVTVTTYAVAWQALDLPSFIRSLRRTAPVSVGFLESLARAVLAGLAGASLALLWDVGPIGFLCGVLALVFLNRGVSSSHFGREALVEPKTGLFNVRYFQEVLESEMERSRRLNRAMTLLMCDLDHLREVNNRYGHATGDLVIRRVAEVIREGTRSFDVPARFGGEEFAVLLPETTARRARTIAERLRREVAAEDFESLTPAGRPSGRHFQVSVSIGVAEFPADASSAAGLLGQADVAAYEAKRLGRNRVVVSGGVALPTLVDREAVTDPRD